MLGDILWPRHFWLWGMTPCFHSLQPVGLWLAATRCSRKCRLTIGAVPGWLRPCPALELEPPRGQHFFLCWLDGVQEFHLMSSCLHLRSFRQLIILLNWHLTITQLQTLVTASCLWSSLFQNERRLLSFPSRCLVSGQRDHFYSRPCIDARSSPSSCDKTPVSPFLLYLKHSLEPLQCSYESWMTKSIRTEILKRTNISLRFFPTFWWFFLPNRCHFLTVVAFNSVVFYSFSPLYPQLAIQSTQDISSFVH